MDDDNVVINCQTIKIALDPEEVEKLIKGITNKDTVIVRDAEDSSTKVAFSPRGSSIMVKLVGTTDGIMMKQGDVDDLLNFVQKGDDDEESAKPAGDEPAGDDGPTKQPAGGDEDSIPKDQEKE